MQSATTIFLLQIAFFVLGVASVAWMTWRNSEMASKIRSHASLTTEIAEIDASVAWLLKAVRRIEGRQTARLGREKITDDPQPPDSTSAAVDETANMDKAALRRYFGLIPGQPARHSNGRVPSST